MSIEFVDEALGYFQECQALLGVELCVEVEESILLASDDGRLRFMAGVFDAIIREKNSLSERVILGGLRALVDPAATMLSYSLFAESGSLDLRSSVLEMMQKVFAMIFSKQCDQVLAHSEKKHLSPWNLLCFMWWELLPRHGVPRIAALDNFDLTILRMMGDLINLDHVACKEAALHGLALWQSAYPEKVQEIIDQHAPAIPSDLQEYALKARRGDLM
jgi:hypothetical protein